MQTMDPDPMDIPGATVTGSGNTEFSTFFAGLRFGPRLMFMDKPLSPYFRIGLHSHDIELISAHIVATISNTEQTATAPGREDDGIEPYKGVGIEYDVWSDYDRRAFSVCLIILSMMSVIWEMSGCLG